MARVVVLGGGFAGLAAAARLARLRHDVTLLEAAGELGGAAGRVVAGEHVWDAGPTHTLLPAVVRDLFLKTGAPLEDEVPLHPVEVLREHRFTDGSAVRLPAGSRAAQLAALEGLETGLGTAWCAHVDSYAHVWETVRRELFERPWDPEVASSEARSLLGSRTSLARALKKPLRDERLRLLATHPFVADGQDPRNVPAWAGMTAYLEQAFGAWAPAGGAWQLTAALARRVADLGVAVHTGTTARDIEVRDGRAVAVATDSGPVDADHVVVAIDPRGLPALARHVARTTPAMPPVTAYVALGDAASLPDLAGETVLHGDPLLIVRPGGQAPPGKASWTLHGRGSIAEDLLTALAREGLDLRAHVEHVVTQSPLDAVRRWHGSPHGVQWQGRGTVTQRLGPGTPVPGVHAAGAHAVSGSGLPFVGMSAALVAAAIGRA